MGQPRAKRIQNVRDNERYGGRKSKVRLIYKESIMCETMKAKENDWHVAIVRSSCEKKVCDEIHKLHDGSVESWVAVQLEMHKWSDRMKKVERIVLRNYVFFRYPQCDEQKELTKRPPFKDIQTKTNVFGLLTIPGSQKPASIPAYQLTRFKEILDKANSKVEVITDDKIKLGDHVQVVKGPFKGLDGYISKDPQGNGKLYIAIDYLGFASMEIGEGMVKPLKLIGVNK